MDTPNPDAGDEHPHTNTQLFGTVAPDDNRFLSYEAMQPPFKGDLLAELTVQLTDLVGEGLDGGDLGLADPDLTKEPASAVWASLAVMRPRPGPGSRRVACSRSGSSWCRCQRSRLIVRVRSATRCSRWSTSSSRCCTRWPRPSSPPMTFASTSRTCSPSTTTSRSGGRGDGGRPRGPGGDSGRRGGGRRRRAGAGRRRPAELLPHLGATGSPSRCTRWRTPSRSAHGCSSCSRMPAPGRSWWTRGR
jgi:hypothetical protein